MWMQYDKLPLTPSPSLPYHEGHYHQNMRQSKTFFLYIASSEVFRLNNQQDNHSSTKIQLRAFNPRIPQCSETVVLLPLTNWGRTEESKGSTGRHDEETGIWLTLTWLAHTVSMHWSIILHPRCMCKLSIHGQQTVFKHVRRYKCLTTLTQSLPSIYISKDHPGSHIFIQKFKQWMNYLMVLHNFTTQTLL